jgi:RNA polymerase sigma factor (sigma-70 family)
MVMQISTVVATGHRGNRVVVGDLEDARDREMVRRVTWGDEDAFGMLFRRYGSAAKALAVRVVRQPFMAEEIVQEAFLSLWRRPNAYREERGSFRAWLMSAVHHRAVDVVRREEAHRRRAVAYGADEPVQPDVMVTEEADIEDQRSRIRAALREIPAEQREVLELMYFQGKTQSRIAEELALPLGTVKSRTLLGMRRLRAMLVEGSR